MCGRKLAEALPQVQDRLRHVRHRHVPLLGQLGELVGVIGSGFGLDVGLNQITHGVTDHELDPQPFGLVLVGVFPLVNRPACFGLQQGVRGLVPKHRHQEEQRREPLLAVEHVVAVVGQAATRPLVLLQDDGPEKILLLLVLLLGIPEVIEQLVEFVFAPDVRSLVLGHSEPVVGEQLADVYLLCLDVLTERHSDGQVCHAASSCIAHTRTSDSPRLNYCNVTCKGCCSDWPS